MSLLTVDLMAPGQSCDPYWKQMICADQVGRFCRADIREHLALAVQECGFKTLRQHGIFDDDLFLWIDEGKPFNFQYLFSIFDFYLSLGIRPFVDLSFMPRWLASDGKTVHMSKCPACPPKDLVAWRRLVVSTLNALVSRYGLHEVRTWNFEVWNEPDIAYWSGTQAQYFELYRVTVDAVKSIDESLRVGGPATSNFIPDSTGNFHPVWIEDFVEYASRMRLPVDFISTHPYSHHMGMRDRDATFHDLAMLRRIVDAGPFPAAAIHANEWNSSPNLPDRTHDHPFSATFHVENIMRCVGLVDSLAHWDLSDVYEEHPPGTSEFHGGFGLLTVHGLKKPVFHAYAFLNKCGGTLLYNDWSQGVACFRSSSASWQLLLYNHHPYVQPKGAFGTPEGIQEMIGTGHSRAFDLELKGLPPRVRLRQSTVSLEHGWAERAWRDMGAPDWPDSRQLASLRLAQEPEVEVVSASTEAGTLTLKPVLADLGMMLIEVEKV